MKQNEMFVYILQFRERQKAAGSICMILLFYPAVAADGILPSQL